MFKWLYKKKLVQFKEELSLDLRAAIEEQAKETQKNLRRLALAQKQQQDALNEALDVVQSIRHTQQREIALALDQEELMQLLDEIHKVSKASLTTPSIQSLATNLESFVLSRCNLSAVAEKGQPYPTAGCDVIGSVQVDGLAGGVVTEIIQQGYKRADGSHVRAAKVIVCQA